MTKRLNKRKEIRGYNQLRHTGLWDIVDGTQFCPYCGKRMILREAGYVKSVHENTRLVCESYPTCDSYGRVKLDKQGHYRVISTPANKELRALRREAHFWMNKLIETGICKSQDDVYFLTRGISAVSNGDEVHIGRCREYACREVIKKCVNILYSNRNKFKRFEGWAGTHVGDEETMKLMAQISYRPKGKKEEACITQ